ncbi:MAG: ABC transporter ATP-binding protein [Hoeflea sp.]|uniref:ABC transporter ATP-binding protein n=1 Tax=Hoeflea sp. TaxID=1940281 RepID=UPI001E14CB9D|nr:ABC transporter ATP-binding protein [Hoeflea sp.]MBU4528116.1 ABC transporter ATP-binding protein [Alphaproteobacteria bacterium]MBU4543712.1 ABC transporter ATP-binding protein [Alphaproteobacteria bacterium]MBU4548579.1 ABC transporter ATP-binding protein [Alphaproteobacteria bacterium]MBV1725745.1 ABC transporter ATP-binding protein [Hoeflea sp.]MBV1762101.1 ABC transporter ATP-binding protein [Hoeflea sp.]
MTGSSQPPILKARGLTKAFGGFRAVNDISLDLGASDILGVIGPNGAGKSTLFNLLAGALPVDSGTIELAGTDLSRARPEARIKAGLGRTFQIPRPFPRMTVLENVMTSAQGQRGESLFSALMAPRQVAAQERANASRAREILDFVSLAHLEDQPASVLSGGQRKLLELARVMMADPRVILLDEPAAGVNPALLDLIIDRILAINKLGIAILLIEHNMEMIARLCPRVIVMAAGKALAEGAPAEITKRADVIDVYLEGMPA